MNAPITATGMQGFLMWLRAKQPYLYRRVEKKIPAPQLAGLSGDDPLVASTSTLPAPSNMVDVIKNLVLGAGQVLLTREQLKAQQKIVDLQLERARQGWPPADIDPTQYGLPAPNVKLGIDSETARMLKIGAGLAGAGLVLYLIFGRRRRRA